MTLDGELDGDVVRAGGDARQRFHDSRGYGYPLAGNEIALAPVEAAHLLFTGNLDAVVADGERLDFRGFAAREPGTAFGVRFLVYADLRSRGLYLSPAREPWLELDSHPELAAADFAVFPRGSGPGDGDVEYALRVGGERTDIPAADLEPGVLAVVDEESEITYFDVDRVDPAGTSAGLDAPAEPFAADLLSDRVVVWDASQDLYERAFYGQPLSGREYDGDRPTLQCSLVEAAHLAARGVVDLDPARVEARGREVEGERFTRRLAVYERLRERGVVPKTGYKFGADFRTYADVDTVTDLGHSEYLLRVCPVGHVFEPRDLALDVRLAHGVRKRIVFAFVDEGRGESDSADDSPPAIDWWSFERLTP